MFYTEFDSLLPESKRGVTFYPEKFAKQIDEINDWVYDTVNNGYSHAGYESHPIEYTNAALRPLKRLMRIMSSRSSSL